jgi:hypothetical protein
MTHFPFGTVSATTAAYLLEQSLLFDGTNQYLTRTPSTAGNRKTWTFSCWVKIADLGTQRIILEGGVAGTSETTLFFGGGNTLEYFQRTSGATDVYLVSSPLFRDSASWMHLAVVHDSTDATAADRVKLYVNGVRITDFSTETTAALNLDSYINSTDAHFIGAQSAAVAANYAGLMALPILVDGAALDATSFGEEDADGYWNPIEFAGTTTVHEEAIALASTGTNIGNATNNGGLAAAFDGVVNTSAACANATGVTLYVGKDWGSGVTKTISSFFMSSPSDDGWSGAAPVTIRLEGSSDNFSSDVNTLHEITGITFGASTVTQTVNWVTTQTTAYRYHRWVITGASGGSRSVGEITCNELISVADSYGTNGGAYDFADTADFGKDVNYTGDTSVTFTDSSVNSGSATTYTFSSQAIGTASADRVVVVGTSGGAGNTNPVSSMTIGGVSAVKAIGIVNSTGTEIWYATVTSGTTASVVVNWGAAKNRCGIGVWALTGVTGVGATNTSTSSTATLTVSGRTKDIVLAVYGGKDHASVTFTGLTEDYDEDISGAGSQYQAGGSKKLTATGSNTITVTPNTGATEVAAVSAVFLATGNNGYFPNNFTASDQLEDTPTDSADDEIGNYCILNPLWPEAGTLSEGNLTASGATTWNIFKGTIPILAGDKKHMEYTFTATDTNCRVGFMRLNGPQIVYGTGDTSGGNTAADCGLVALHDEVGQVKSQYNAITMVSDTGFSLTGGEVITIEIDKDAGAVYAWVDGSAVNSGASMTTGAGITFLQDYDLVPVVNCYQPSPTNIITANFGQKAWTKTPTTGYTGIATQNLPAPTIADGSDYFNTVLYTGNGTAIASGGNPVTGVGFQPDFIWLKDRTSSNYHQLYDVVRGAQNAIYSNDTLAEGNFPEALNSIDSNGFTLGNNTGCNNNTNNYVAWCWKAGGTAVTNTDGTITSSVSANPTAGFSIVTWTGTGVAATVGHGLGVPNDFMIFKSRSNVSSPGVVTSALGFTKDLLLETTDAAYTRAAISNNTAPTSTVFSVGTDTAINVSGYTYVAYCWAEVEGFSKFGSYTGNGSADGPFVYTGFRPAFVLIKRTDSTGDWNINDSARVGYNPVADTLNANETYAEGASDVMDILSNGFKIRFTGTNFNASGGTYIYAAFAEHPFQGDAGVTQGRAR